MRELSIADRRIADDTDAWVCAEIGANHQGSVAICKDIIAAAAQAGAQAVKLQKRDLPTWEEKDPEAWHREYHSEHAFGATYGEHRAALEFDFDQYAELKAYAQSLGLVFFATAWDVPSLHFLVELGVPAIKLASASIVDVELLRAVAASGLPAILSTGGATLPEIDAAVQIFDDMTADLAVLNCTSIYPCEAKDLNLGFIRTLRKRYSEHVVGQSDHQSGIAMAPVAVAMGARIVEKHTTLHRHWKGSDQAFSLEPDGLRRLCRDVRRVREAMGTGVKERLDAEIPALIKMGRKDLDSWVPSAFVTAT